MKAYTFHELVEIAMERGANCADVAIARMMDEIEAETGHWPNWNDANADYIEKIDLGGHIYAYRGILSDGRYFVATNLTGLYIVNENPMPLNWWNDVLDDDGAWLAAHTLVFDETFDWSISDKLDALYRGAGKVKAELVG